jgi:hypothetical protein
MSEDYGTAKWVEREDAHARQVLSTAKLVVTFSAAIAAGFVSAAMQNNDSGWWSETSAGLMFVVLYITLRVVLKQAPRLESKKLEGHPHEEVQAALKGAAIADKGVADAAHSLMVWQVRLSVVTSIVAAIGLFVGTGSP